MKDMMSREIRLASRPKGFPTAANFTMAQTKLEPLQDREVLVRNLFMSVDPYLQLDSDERSTVWRVDAALGQPRFEA